MIAIHSAEAKSREDIVRLAKSIFDRGLTFGSLGNISIRIEDGWLMTPTNFSLGRLDRRGCRSSTMTADSSAAIRRPRKSFCIA